MFKLDSSRSLEVVLGGAVASNQLHGAIAYIDMIQKDGVSRQSQLGADLTFRTSDATDVTAVPAPLVVGTIREWDGLNLYNADTATAQVTVKINTSNVDTILVNQIVAPGETLYCTQKAGWGII